MKKLPFSKWLVIAGLGLPALCVTAVGLEVAMGREHRAFLNAFMDDVRASRVAEAYGATSSAFQQEVPIEAFPAYLQATTPRLLDSDSSWIYEWSAGSSYTVGDQGVTSHGRDSCMDVWLFGKQWSFLNVYVVEEQGGWKVRKMATDTLPECDSD